MRTKDIAERLLSFIQELTAFYAEISEELSENHLRIAVDNTHGNSELKKIPRKLLTFKVTRRNAKDSLTNSPRNCGNLTTRAKRAHPLL